MPQSPDHSPGDEPRDQESEAVTSFDGIDGGRTLGSDQPCGNCGEPFHEHDKERVYHGGGRYSYNYNC